MAQTAPHRFVRHSRYMYVRVHVVAGARKENVHEEGEHLYTISVRERAERNQANRRVIEILRDRYMCDASRVRLITGHHSRTKVFSIDEASLPL